MKLRNLFFALAAAATLNVAAVDKAEVTLTWPMGENGSTTATVSEPDLFSVSNYTVGSDLKITRYVTVSGTQQTLFQPATSNVSDRKDEDAVTFTVIPKKGVKFQPTAVSFLASRHGTGGGVLALEVASGSETKLVNAKMDPERSNTGNLVSHFNETVSGLPLSDSPVTVKIYITSLANNKEVGLANIVLTGIADGEAVTVPVYTVTATPATEEAGEVSVSPTGTSFDEGTRVTVTATENFGYHFDCWTDAAGNKVSEANPYTFEVTGDIVLTANYTKSQTYKLDLTIEGGANDYQVQCTPEGYLVDGVRYYEEGTEVSLRAIGNRILSFLNWEDNSTSAERLVKIDSDKELTATFSAVDYIVGWDFYYDEPASERAADFKAESDNAGLMSLRNAAGQTTSWLSRGIVRGQENGKYGARVWKLRSDKNYFEMTFSTVGYTDITLCAALGASYNTYSRFFVEYSTDGGETFKKCGEYDIIRGWTEKETALPADAAGCEKLKIRFMPDYDAALVGNETDYDGLCIAEVFVLGDFNAMDDTTAPVLVSSIPADGTDGASATGSIVLTFDEKIKMGDAVATLAGENLTGKAAGNTAVFSYSGLDYGKEYQFVLPEGGVVDRSGNRFAGCTLNFTTMERQQPDARLFDAIVAADNSGDYLTLQDAIDAAPTGRNRPWLIFVKNGNYKGHVDIPSTKPYMHIIGQDRDKTVIVDDRLCGGDNAVHVSVGATVVVNSNDCLFENITLENSYGHEKQDGPQALALNTTGDRTIFNNVAMLSYQDTWITPSTSAYRAYVRNSLIEGAVDFIYNSGDIYIENTTLLITRKSGGYIVAPSHGKDVAWGYVFNNCKITADGDPTKTTVWLGRPWHNFPKTVFLNTRAEVTIPATGWYETMGGLPAIWADWNTTDINGNPVDLSQRRDTYYYVDSTTKERVYGTAKNHLTDEEAAEYTVKNVLSGSDDWQPVIKTEPCAAPAPRLEADGSISWEAIPYAICYLVTDGDKVVAFTTETSILPAARADVSGYKVQAVNEYGGLSQAASVATTGIADLEADEAQTVVEVVYYDIQGRRIAAPVTGVNIVSVRYADGSVKVEKLVK